MILDKEVKQLFNQLTDHESAEVNLDEYAINIRVFDKASKLSLSTPVYSGGNFIPKSVRQCASHRRKISKHMNTYLTVDEQNFKINLHYLGALHTNANSQKMKHLIEEFNSTAQEWRHLLDEHDKKDLLHVRVK